MATFQEYRLQSHGIGASKSSSVEEVIQHYGAIQAQDYQQACWVLGSRVSGATLDDVEKAIREKKIVRMRPMRGTLHFVDPQLAYTFLDTCAYKTLKSFAKRREYLEISDDDAQKALKLIESALSGGTCLTRKELEQALMDGGLIKKKQWLYHLTCYAAARKLICFGPKKGKEDTFVLLEDWLADIPQLLYDDGIAHIARCYFRGHGPATLDDLGRRTGWNKTESKLALKHIVSELESREQGGKTYYMLPAHDSQSHPGQRLLGGFDEYFLGYKEREIVANAPKSYFTTNGIFAPVIVANGKVVGKWKRRFLKDKVVITLEHIDKSCELDLAILKEQADSFATFWGVSHAALEVK